MYIHVLHMLNSLWAMQVYTYMDVYNIYICKLMYARNYMSR